MTPEVELRIKQQTWERMRQRLGNGYLTEHADFLEAQWDWAKELGMINEETIPPTGGSREDHRTTS